MNSSTNVTRQPTVDDDKLFPVLVFTANNTPCYLNSLTKVQMPSEDFVRNFGRRMHYNRRWRQQRAVVSGCGGAHTAAVK